MEWNDFIGHQVTSSLPLITTTHRKRSNSSINVAKCIHFCLILWHQFWRWHVQPRRTRYYPYQCCNGKNEMRARMSVNNFVIKIHRTCAFVMCSLLTRFHGHGPEPTALQIREKYLLFSLAFFVHVWFSTSSNSLHFLSFVCHRHRCR